VRELAEAQASKKYRLLTEFERFALAEFAGLMFTRTPAGIRLGQQHTGPKAKELMKKAALDPAIFAKHMRPGIENSGMPEHTIDAELEDARQKILAGYLDTPERPEMRLEAMFRTGLMIANSLKTKDCEIVVATRHEDFITGDTPVITQSSAGFLGTSFAGANTHVWLPLGEKLCAHWPRREGGDGWAKMPPRGVRMINRTIMQYAERYIYSGTYSSKLAETFTRIPQSVILGTTAFIPARTLEEIEDLN